MSNTQMANLVSQLKSLRFHIDIVILYVCVWVSCKPQFDPAMSRTAKTLLCLIFSVLLLFNIHWFTSHKHARVKQGKVTFGHFNGDEENSWPKIDEDDVVALNQKNFSQFMAKNRYVMVVFYARWCYWSKRLAPEYAAAATMLKDEGSKALLAKVDVTEENELKRKYNIQGYPTLYFFVGGVDVDQFIYERTRDTLASWVKTKMIPGVYNIMTPKEAERILNSGSIIVLAFVDDLEGPDSEELAAAANIERSVKFYQTASPDAAKSFHIDPQIKRPALIMLKEDAENYVEYDGQFTAIDIANFVCKNSISLVTTLTKRNAPLILEIPMKQIWLFAHQCDTENVASGFREAAKTFKGKLLFVYADTSYDFHGNIGRRLCHDFHVSCGASRVIAYNGNDKGQNHTLNNELTLTSIKSFGEAFLKDNLSSSNLETVLGLALYSPADDPTSLPHNI